MTADESFRDAMRGVLRDRLLDAARDLTINGGWGSVTMAAIAAEVGVSRQTVYNELGAKDRLAEALVLRELERFLEVVRDRVLAADDVVTALRDACEGALDFAERNPLVSAALSSLPEGGNELLPLLTTDSARIVETAKLVVIDSLAVKPFDLPFAPDELDRAVEMVIRLVLSALTRPSRTPAQTADDIAWMFRLVLAGTQASLAADPR